MISKNLIRHHDLGSVIVEALDRLIDLHLMFLLTGYKVYCVCIVFLGPETDHYRFPRLWFGRISVISRSVTEKSVLIQHRPHIQNVLHFSGNVFVFPFHN